MNYHINTISPNDNLFDQFKSFKKELYPQLPPQFLQEKIDFKFLKALVIAQNNKNDIVARAAFYYNPEIEYKGQKCCSFGNFEFQENHEKAAQAIIQQLESASLALGVHYLIGPMNASTWNNYRWAEKVNEPFCLEPFQKPYYIPFIKDQGYKVLHEYNSKAVNSIPYEGIPMEERARYFSQELNIKIRPIELDQFEKELKKLYPLVQKAFSQNLFFTKISEEEFIQKQWGAKDILNKDYTTIAEDQHGNFIAFFFCLDNHFNAAEKSLIIKTIARDPDPKYKGLGQWIGNLIYEKSKKDKYDSIIHALMDTDANSTEISTKYSGHLINRYFLFAKPL